MAAASETSAKQNATLLISVRLEFYRTESLITKSLTKPVNSPFQRKTRSQSVIRGRDSGQGAMWKMALPPEFVPSLDTHDSQLVTTC